MRLIGAAAIALVLTLTFTSASAREESHRRFDGREIFRFDTFGDEQLWTSVLRLHEAVQTLSPETALSVGLKVDAESAATIDRRGAQSRHGRPERSNGHDRIAPAKCRRRCDGQRR